MSELRQLAARRAQVGSDRDYCCAPLTCIGTVCLVAIILIGSQQQPQHPMVVRTAATVQVASLSSSKMSAPIQIVRAPICGDGKCELPETMANCMADCPGVTTPPTCGEEPHSDPGGYAVVWGASHKKASAAECCDACAAHAADPKNSKRPCNSWVFCHALPYCWSLDTGNFHGFGECWLKSQTNPEHPLCECAATLNALRVPRALAQPPVLIRPHPSFRDRIASRARAQTASAASLRTSFAASTRMRTRPVACPMAHRATCPCRRTFPGREA